MAEPHDDPGWPPLHRSLLGVVLPSVVIRQSQRQPDALVALRTVFLAFCSALVMVGVLVILIGPGMDHSLDGSVAALLTAAVGVALQGVGRVVDRPLDCAALAASYRTRFFLRIAFAEAAALLGFVLVILSGNVLVYLVGLVIAAYGFARAAPTAAHLRQDQDDLLAAGCGTPLVPALRGA